MRPEDWQRRAAEHAARVEPWVEARLRRRATGSKHAVDDFLFDYYPFSPAKLSAWHPGYGVVLEGPAPSDYLLGPDYLTVAGGVTADLSRLAARLPRLKLAIRILSGTMTRPAMTGCFGMHEWAMVYGLAQDEVRHEDLPLRISPETITETVDGVGLRCTHIDAFRFFTPAAIPLNSLEPTRATQPDLEQPGCLHATMDLYKYAFWFSPLVSSDLVMDCFEIAARARELDMRAAPYDLVALGYEPIRVETPAGRAEYAREQRAIMDSAETVRSQLHGVLGRLLEALPLHS